MKTKNLILIKLGGSTITDKNVRKKVEIEKIRQLAGEISTARKKTDDLIIISHGQGSFAHYPASKYKTKEGFIDNQSPIGLSKVRLECIELNFLVISELIEADIPAVTIEPFAAISTAGKKLDQIFLQPFINSLNSQLVPVVYGDTLSDSEIGCTIYSGETILNILALKLQNNFNIKTIIEVGKTDGVYDENGKIIPEINNQNFSDVRKNLTGSHGTDVTGGMLHKVDEAHELSKKGIATLLIGFGKGNLEKAILNQPVLGTWIR
jgi:isopentenyl phosphate kinase